ncbi:MAG: phytanoyl-CoA dioxygenase family protein [Planctomycetaceae bacterium]
MIGAAETAEFRRSGFLVVREFLAAPMLHTLQAELDRYIRTVVPELPGSAAFYHDPRVPATLKQLQQMAVDPFFDRVRHQEHWVHGAQALLAEPVHAQEPEWFNKPAGTDHATPPHQDNYYFCLKPPNALTIWVAIDPVDADNGCLRYIEGSHRRGIRDHRSTTVLGFSQGITDYDDSDRAREVAITLKPGDAVIHHCETIHRADANRSEARERRAFAIVFRGASCQRDASAYQRYQASLKLQHQQFGVD